MQHPVVSHHGGQIEGVVQTVPNETRFLKKHVLTFVRLHDNFILHCVVKLFVTKFCDFTSFGVSNVVQMHCNEIYF